MPSEQTTPSRAELIAVPKIVIGKSAPAATPPAPAERTDAGGN